MAWYYKDEIFTEEMIGDYVGFVYMITDLDNGMKYIGKKLFHTTQKLKPLKGKKRRRTVVKQSDWQEYFSSSDTIKALVEERGADTFHREILHLCRSKGELSYMEAKLQFDNDVLLRSDFYNGIIQCRINQSHVKNLWIDEKSS
jgi:hypothetical protein